VTHAVRRFEDPADLAHAVGQRLGESRWHEVTQAQVDRFAEATGDDQWIHVDVHRAVRGPFGGTIAHGYLVLALVPRLLGEVFEVGDLGLMVNAGVDAVRFLRPVPVGAQVRLVADLVSIVDRMRGAVEASIDVSIEMRDRPGPVCQARAGFILRPARPTRVRRPVAATPPAAAPRALDRGPGSPGTAVGP
jgi:acyl dehydratase